MTLSSVAACSTRTTPTLDRDNAASHIGFDSLMLDLNTLGFNQLLEELLLVLVELGHQVVDVVSVSAMQVAELLVEYVELVGSLEGSIKHIHCEVQVEGIVIIIFWIVIVVVVFFFI